MNLNVKIAEIENLQTRQQVVSEETLRDITEEVKEYVAMTGNNDLQHTILFVLNLVGNDRYQAGIKDCLDILRKGNNKADQW